MTANLSLRFRRKMIAISRDASTRALLSLALVAVALLGLPLGIRPVAAQPVAAAGLSGLALDSVRAGLASGDWNERHAALLRINGAFPDVLPPAIADLVVALLAREATTRIDAEGDEAFGEYVVDLVLTGVRTADARTIPAILQLDGLGISSGVAAFVASQGPIVMPALDALARTRDDRASDVVETYALMYSRYSSRLVRADSVQILRRLLAAASDTSSAVRSQVIRVAARAPIPELHTVVSELAASDPELWEGVYVVRRDATTALPAIDRARAAVATGTLLNRLTLLTEAACDGAERRLRGRCVALAASLGTAARFVAAGEPAVAVQALDRYQRAAQRLGADGLMPRLTAVTLEGTARAVMERL